MGYQRPREKKPSSASTRTTMRMIQRMPMLFRASLVGWVVDLTEVISAERKRETGGFRYAVTAVVTRVAQKTACTGQ